MVHETVGGELCVFLFYLDLIPYHWAGQLSQYSIIVLFFDWLLYHCDNELARDVRFSQAGKEEGEETEKGEGRKEGRKEGATSAGS